MDLPVFLGGSLYCSSSLCLNLSCSAVVGCSYISKLCWSWRGWPFEFLITVDMLWFPLLLLCCESLRVRSWQIPRQRGGPDTWQVGTALLLVKRTRIYVWRHSSVTGITGGYTPSNPCFIWKTNLFCKLYLLSKERRLRSTTCRAIVTRSCCLLLTRRLSDDARWGH